VSREQALAAAVAHHDSGAVVRDLARPVAGRTESQEAGSLPALAAYLSDELSPALTELGFAFALYPNPNTAYRPLMIATRLERDDLPTVLMYGTAM
jgi:hypothetical protein